MPIMMTGNDRIEPLVTAICRGLFAVQKFPLRTNGPLRSSVALSNAASQLSHCCRLCTAQHFVILKDQYVGPKRMHTSVAWRDDYNHLRPQSSLAGMTIWQYANRPTEYR